MNILQAIILGIVQGLTEFLPVSSSGHIELGKVLLNTQNVGIDFSILVHIATALSTVIVFRRDIAGLIMSIFRLDRESIEYAAKLILSAVPVGVVGLLFKDQLELLFEGRIILVGCMLIVTALLLFLTTRVRTSEKPVGFVEAIVIGFAQMVAILPGISRSGATIATALLLKVDRTQAAKFSFLMVLIPIFGQAFLDLLDMAKGEAAWSMDTGVALAGFLAAFISGLVACTFMLQIVRRGKLYYFSIYCVIVGLIAIVAGLA
ncbi:MAG: undecaprenyl-diphosphate phosphatase [Bacteroidia bacterium]